MPDAKVWHCDDFFGLKFTITKDGINFTAKINNTKLTTRFCYSFQDAKRQVQLYLENLALGILLNSDPTRCEKIITYEDGTNGTMDQCILDKGHSEECL